MKHRSTLDVVCAAVTGSLSRPRELVVGFPIDGTLRVVGRTTLLSPGARRALAPVLRAPSGEHQWPSRISPGRFAARTAPVDLTLVEPFVVEVSADTAWSGTSWRHPVRAPDVPLEEAQPPTLPPVNEA